MNSTLDDRTREVEAELDEPHFDEEATLLGAQPVVPLVEVQAKTRLRSRLALALAICGGLLIGLLAATLVYRYFGDTEPTPAETTAVAEQPIDESQSHGGGATVSRGETAANATKTENAPTVVPPTEKPSPAREPDPQPQAAPRPRPVTVRDGADDEEIDRAVRKAERQAERRERRRANREAKRQNRDQVQTTDDLLRIREIFEGTPRP